MRSITKSTFALLLSIMVAGCASLGDTPAEKRAAVLKMRDETMARLYKDEPQARAQVKSAAGYGVFDGASQNLILLQTSGGYGVMTAANGAVTYMKVGGAGVGFGLGIKDYREVLIFRNQRAFEHFRDSGWDASARAEATAKAGVQGGSANAQRSVDLDVIVYQMTEAGAALQATIGATKYWNWKQLNAK